MLHYATTIEGSFMVTVNPRALAALCLTTLFCLTGTAHEFWLEPLDYRLDAGERLRAHIKIGEYFKGNTYAYFPQRFESFSLTINSRTEPVKARMGTTPAVGQTLDQPGLAILTYQSNYEQLTYEDADTFRNFLELDGLEWVRQAHRERGLPPTGFTEAYRRFAKAYIAIGHGRGQDRRFGLPFEWVLEANPYERPAGADLHARLYYRGEPFAGSLVRVFIRSGDEQAEELRLRTDAEGRVALPYQAKTEYLVSSVHMIEASKVVADTTGAVWESLWASAVFYRP